MSEQTKYILTGGRVDHSPDMGQKYCREVCEGLGPRIQVLECFFASENDYRDRLQRDIQMFSRSLKGVDFSFQVANRQHLIQQLYESDILVFRGGLPAKALSELSQYPNIQDHFVGKVVVAESAGAYALASKFLSVNDHGETSLQDGLGVLPVGVVAHYRSDFYPSQFPDNFSWDKVDIMIKQDPELKWYLLREGDFTRIK